MNLQPAILWASYWHHILWIFDPNMCGKQWCTLLFFYRKLCLIKILTIWYLIIFQINKCNSNIKTKHLIEALYILNHKIKNSLLLSHFLTTILYSIIKTLSPSLLTQPIQSAIYIKPALFYNYKAVSLQTIGNDILYITDILYYEQCMNFKVTWKVSQNH